MCLELAMLVALNPVCILHLGRFYHGYLKVDLL